MLSRTIPILYIHHAGAFGGASCSLLELIESFPPDAVVPHLVTPRGSVVPSFAARGVDIIGTAGISRFDHTRYGHYRGKRWLLLLREAWYLPFTLLALVRARLRWKNIAIVHVNEVISLAAIVLAKVLFRCPVVVHVRSVQQGHDGGRRTALVRHVLERWADSVVAIDETVRRSLPPGIPADVVHNGIAPGASAAPQRATGDRKGPLRVALVGNLLPLKGVREFIEAARLCRDRNLSVEFRLVGANVRELKGIAGWALQRTGFAVDLHAEVARFVAQHRLEANVRMVGFTADVDAIYRDIDLLCFPSHLDAVGRPVFEAALYRVPSIVALSDPLPDTLVPRETGLCVPPGNPGALADAVEYFCRNPAEIRRMGEAACQLALSNFDSRKNAARVLEIYRGLLAR
jgi:glycosyltransferase involved in cell wall biosynthesis